MYNIINILLYLYIFKKNILEPFVDHEPLPVMAPKLQDEVWFHGSITRQHAEALLKHVSGM